MTTDDASADAIKGVTDWGAEAEAQFAAEYGIDITTPSAARIYDWYLGGAHNFEVDRAFGREYLRMAPRTREVAVGNRRFLTRVVTWLVRQGIDQFLDIGSGVPTAGNVHEVVQRVNPDAHTVYVDYEPVAVAHAELVLDQTDPKRERTDVVMADFRQPQEILAAESVQRLLDLDRPVAVLLVAVVHFLSPADRPGEHLAWLRDRLAPGSHLAISSLTAQDLPADVAALMDRAGEMYRTTTNPVYPRDRAEVAALFDGFELLPPGVAWLAELCPDEPVEDPASSMLLGAIGRKP